MELEFKQFAHQPKIEEKMEADKEFLETYSVVLGIDKAIEEIRHEADEKGIEKGIEKITIRQFQKGKSLAEIADIVGLPVEHVKEIIERYKKSMWQN